MYACKIIEDSIWGECPRLTTFVITYPRFVHAELMTHRVFSRNSSSSRAIPNAKLLERIESDPVLPVSWGKNQKGMQAGEELSPEDQTKAQKVWLEARDLMLHYSKVLSDIGVHKQLCNRLVEPWMWITVVVTSTDWNNWFHLRCSPLAQPEIAKIAYMMRDAISQSDPVCQRWHLPFVTEEERKRSQGLPSYIRFGATETIPEIALHSVARCARVSYLTHEGELNPEKDLALAKSLASNGHWSPFEHVAIADQYKEGGNLRGWQQIRHIFPTEYVQG